jgi:hypothetical protein
MLLGLEPKEPLRRWDPDKISTEDINLFILSSLKGLAEITKTKAQCVKELITVIILIMNIHD